MDFPGLPQTLFMGTLWWLAVILLARTDAASSDKYYTTVTKLCTNVLTNILFAGKAGFPRLRRLNNNTTQQHNKWELKM